jgi:hypothetical protein
MEIANKADLDAWLYNHAHSMGHICHGIRGDVPGEEGRVNVAWVDTDTGDRFGMVYYDPENLEEFDDPENDLGLVPHFLHDDSCPSYCDYACNPDGFDQAEMITRTRMGKAND